MAYIALNDYKARANIALTDTSQDPVISWLLTSFSSTIDQYTNNTWTGTATISSSQNFYGWGNGVNYMPIGIWQYSGLTVQYGTLDDSSTLQTLTENTDYIVSFVPGTNNTVINQIILTNLVLTEFSYIVISGTAYQSSLPADLERAIFFATLVATAFYKSNGNGLILEDRIADVSTRFAISDDYFTYAANLAAGDLLAVPAIASMLMTYSIQTGQFGRAF